MKSIARTCAILVSVWFLFLAADNALGAEYLFPQVADGRSGALTSPPHHPKPRPAAGAYRSGRQSSESGSP